MQGFIQFIFSCPHLLPGAGFVTGYVFRNVLPQVFALLASCHPSDFNPGIGIHRNPCHRADLVFTSPLSCAVHCGVLSLTIALCNYLIHLLLCSVSPRQDVRAWWKPQPVALFIAVYAVPQTACHDYLTNIYWMSEWKASEMETLCLPLSSVFL